MSADVGASWYVARTNPHAEAKASLHLRRQGYEVYLPRYFKQRRHARRIEKVAAPLFPGYLFVAIDLATQRWLSIDSTIGVARLVCQGDRPALVPQSVIDALMRRHDAEGCVQLDRRPRFSPGDKIRVAGKTPKTKILLVRVGERKQGVIGLFQPGLTGEQSPGLSVRFMGISDRSLASYLISLYCSASVLADDAIAALDDVEVGQYHEYK